MINFVVVSHSKKLAAAAIDLAKIMSTTNFKMVNAAGMRDTEDFGSDASLIMNKVNEVKEKDGVLVFCELGSSLINSQMAIELLNDDKVKLVDAPLVEGLIIGASSNFENTNIDDLYAEIMKVKDFSKLN